MKKRSNRYWIRRSNQTLTDVHKGSDKYIANINTAYDKALKDVQEDINKIFQTYANNHNLTAIEAKKLLNSKISVKEIEHLREEITQISNVELKKHLLSQINANAYKARITRLEALKQSMQVHYGKLADKETQISKLSYTDTINDAYYKNIFNIQKGIDIGFNVAQLPTKTIELMLNKPFLGSNYSQRVWNNTDVLADKLTETITSEMISGKSVPKMVKELEELTEFGKFAAERLVRTETTYFANQASMESYKECDIKKYIFVATLDLRTSKVCQEHDRKVYEVRKGVPGSNLPPLHPFCRSTTRAYLGEEYMKNIRRRARDPETGKTYTVGNMNYEDWHNKYVKGKANYSENKGSIINNEYEVNLRYINTKKYTDKFKNIGANSKVDIRIRNESIKILKHRNKTNFEDIAYLDVRTGKTIYRKTDSTKPFGVSLGNDKDLIDAYKGELIAIHNHPGSTRPSIGDIITMQKSPNVIKSVIIGHNGKVHIIDNMNKKVGIEKLFEERYTYFKDKYLDKDIAMVKSTNTIYNKKIFDYTVR